MAESMVQKYGRLVGGLLYSDFFFYFWLLVWLPFRRTLFLFFSVLVRYMGGYLSITRFVPLFFYQSSFFFLSLI